MSFKAVVVLCLTVIFIFTMIILSVTAAFVLNAHYPL